ncbi:MAG: DUF1549 and DUF1553 domain-containing protein [Fuerstiella sp.]|nr:DUF1549 and DUF1553 domain-containing protein [Fuerstiella sp.]
MLLPKNVEKFPGRCALRIAIPVLVLLGGRLVADDSEDQLAAYDASIVQSDREHWAYVPVRQPQVPAVEDTDWIRTPIDNFVLVKLEQQGWRPAPTARPHDLLRRLYLDLTGLPPTIDRQDRFLEEPTAEHFDEQVDQLLRQTGYGERWARHWLDLVRYAESNGYERDAEKRHVWRYRDYVIDALNQDKPYDRFVLEQLAGDEMTDRNTQTVLATSFYRLGSWDDEPADSSQYRHDQLDDIIRTTSQVFLGLSLGCARCHDHKFDALTMHDYYRMSAIMAPMKRPRRDADMPAGSIEQLEQLAERDRMIEGLRNRQQELRDGFREKFLTSGVSSLDQKVLSAFTIPVDERNSEQKQLVTTHQTNFDQQLEDGFPPQRKRRFDDLRRQITQLQEQIPDLPKGYFLHEESPKPPGSFLLLRGRAASPGPEVQPGLPAVLVREQPAFHVRERSTGRRLRFAKWIASAENPLTARVIVNRVWQYHFGEGIVRTPSDFGVMGDSPTHPELLDWLTHWFVNDANWSLKKLHRLIVCSNTYRMSKSSNSEYAQLDPANRLLWRFPYQRLQVETIRDSILASSGRLNREMYGPGVKLDIPQVVIESHADRNNIWEASGREDQSRRTVYAFVKRSIVVPMLEVLDFCDTTRSTEKRNITSVSPQALTLFNGDFVNQQATYLAERVIREVGDDPSAQVARAWRLTLCRLPNDEERRAMVDFMETETQRSISELKEGEELTAERAHRRAFVQVCRVIYNLNEFSYPN